MIKKFNIVILISTLFIITFSACNKESTLPIQNENQNSTNELKSLVSQVKFWHDSIVSNKTKGVNVKIISNLSAKGQKILRLHQLTGIRHSLILIQII